MADTASTESRVRASLDRLAGDLPALGIALSGGGDSTALLHIAHGWARGRRLMAATVDHGLRPESAAEARTAQKVAETLGIPHATLKWQRDTTEGNLMANARDARLRLLSGWAQRNDLPAVLLGHTQDDQAETLLMRLARGAGVDGLAGMAEWRDAFGIRWLRPMLSASRASLRDWLAERGLRWIDDPSNDNADFDRIRIRKAMAALQLDPAALAQSARNIGQARDALAHYAAQAADEATADRGSLVLPRAPFRLSPPEVQRRLAVAAARWITGADYPPRRATVAHALAALAAGSRVTLDGALFWPAGDRIRVIREPAAAMRAAETDAPVWDNRWQINGLSPGQTVAALGFESLDQVNWRLSGLSRDEAAASPAIRAKGRVLAAPALRPQAPWHAEPLRGATEFGRLVHLD
ncbi:MAG: tRNA lysidine(34) synthetase TilS [Paracoccus sp. (in: a-proteobacteria)]|uniref:tRNA lysidine(34) synthetase TilS n=1 Tax=Paracoccus sp. TaxID=267 RepID=UPI0026E08EFB|nr:tRNA lysidine(34) synthetase TilS [Paracoccus sp. (in: a-proteobacteria)]MDO5613276.1 tRNA lysidine(34) synthetase TilS [Paracoccus sp. (in: a-proteobacteria)]